jgi:hypothetical protein
MAEREVGIGGDTDDQAGLFILFAATSQHATGKLAT